jgi:hypothetical protein
VACHSADSPGLARFDAAGYGNAVKIRFFVFLSAVFLAPFAHGFPAYYDISEHDLAQAEARQRNLPLAWLGGIPEDLNVGNPLSGSQADLEQMAMATLRDNAVIIFFDGRNMAPVPQIVHAQFHIQDDGPLSNGAAWVIPKVVFTNPEVTQILGRVSATQMGEDRDAALNSALQIIRNNPTALTLPEAPSPSPVTDAASKADATNTDMWSSGLSAGWVVADFFNQYGILLGIVLALLAGFLVWLAWSRRQT